MSKKLLCILLGLNLFWAFSATIYDWQAIQNIPFFYWPIIIVCPIFPLLLAILWYLKSRNGKVNQFYLSIIAIISFSYGLGSLFFYPTIMHYNGFDWLNFGQIFWVWFYASQGLYLLVKEKGNIWGEVVGISIFSVSVWVQIRTNSFGYLDYSTIPREILNFEFIGLIILILLVFVFKYLFSVYKQLSNSLNIK